jgi:hypothetical protein
MEKYCRVRQATNTHSEYVIVIAFPLTQCLHERASMLRYACRHYMFVGLLAQVTMKWQYGTNCLSRSSSLIRTKFTKITNRVNPFSWYNIFCTRSVLFCIWCSGFVFVNLVVDVYKLKGRPPSGQQLSWKPAHLCPLVIVVVVVVVVGDDDDDDDDDDDYYYYYDDDVDVDVLKIWRRSNKQVKGKVHVVSAVSKE